MTATLSPVQWDAPLVNPSPAGLYAAASWTDEDAPNRWLSSGLVVRPHNYGGEAAFGVWGASWCAQPDDLTAGDIKAGTRPGIPDPFLPVVVWAYDECDPTAESKAEIRTRVQQNLRLIEQVAVEREFATTLLADAGIPSKPADLVGAVAHLEGEFAKTNTVGQVHASATLAAVAARYGLIQRSGTGLRTPLGHLWVFGGGYVDGLGDTLVGTSPTYGWRSTVEVRETDDVRGAGHSSLAVAERAVLVGYEKLVAAATITP